MCIVTSLRSGPNWLIPIIVQENFPFSNWSFQRGNVWKKFSLTACLHLVSAQRMRGGIPLLHS